MSKLHDKVNRNRMTQYVCICIYTYIYIYRVELGQRRYMYTTGVLLRYAFFHSASTIQRCMRERQRKRNRHKGGWVHRSETRACLSTPQYARKYTLPGIYYYTYIPLRPIRKNRRETRNLSRTISFWKMNLLLSLCRVRVPCIECAAPRKISRPSCINGKSIYEYILQCKSDIDCRGDLSGTVTMLMLQ